MHANICGSCFANDSNIRISWKQIFHQLLRINENQSFFIKSVKWNTYTNVHFHRIIAVETCRVAILLAPFMRKSFNIVQSVSYFLFVFVSNEKLIVS